MSEFGPFQGMGRRSGVALLLAALLVPAFLTGIGEVPPMRSPEGTVLVVPAPMEEMLSDRETASARC